MVIQDASRSWIHEHTHRRVHTRTHSRQGSPRSLRGPVSSAPSRAPWPFGGAFLGNGLSTPTADSLRARFHPRGHTESMQCALAGALGQRCSRTVKSFPSPTPLPHRASPSPLQAPLQGEDFRVEPPASEKRSLVNWREEWVGGRVLPHCPPHFPVPCQWFGSPLPQLPSSRWMRSREQRFICGAEPTAAGGRTSRGQRPWSSIPWPRAWGVSHSR